MPRHHPEPRRKGGEDVRRADGLRENGAPPCWRSIHSRATRIFATSTISASPKLPPWSSLTGSASTAPRCVELESRGTPPDLVLTGDPGIEKPETYTYQKMIAAWMAARGIRYETVRYTPRRFKHWPPYYDLLANVLTNATLPSISLGRHSCSLGPA